MAELKTKLNDGNVEDFLNAVQDERKRVDSLAILEIMQRLTGEEPKMWGSSIIGFGSYHYRYDSGREGDWFKVGFSPRKQNLTLYIMAGFARHEELMGQLGKYKTGKSCLYIKQLEDVDQSVLEDLITSSVDYISQRYPN